MAEVSLHVAKQAGNTEIEGFEDEIDEQQFVSPSKSLPTYQVGFVPKNTLVNTKWTVKNVTDKEDSYNACHPDELCPGNILLCDSPSDLSLWLQRYVLGTTKKDGSKYPSKTLFVTVWIVLLHERK